MGPQQDNDFWVYPVKAADGFTNIKLKTEL